MTRFYPIFVRRSDGKTEVVTKGKRKEPNQPTDEQLDQRPDKDGISDFYREVVMDEAKHLDWRRKLGGMLARELGWQDKAGDHGYILAAFPENYRLYEHIKKTEKDGKLEVKSKTHAAGGNDRQDAYLYGHPIGRRKRFRSPSDFFPHLLWLCTDESGDPENCSCKICSPEDLETLVPGAKTKTERPVKVEGEAKPVTGASMVRQSSIQGSKARSDPPTPIQRPAAAAAATATAAPPISRPAMPTQLPPIKSQDQHIDSMYNAFMYRTGELVWFRRGVAWGLGVIVRRWATPTQQACYQVQPLSHPYKHPPSVIKSGNDELRPWLAWSVPLFTEDALNKMQEPLRYENADWQGMVHQQYGKGDVEVDASILAAKSIDATYTPYGKGKPIEVAPSVVETPYDGVFLGAERLWIGDAVRLRVGSGQDIMVVHSVVDRRNASAMGGQPSQATVQLVGDVYILVTVPHSNPAIPTPASPHANPCLPTRLTEDLVYRNARTIGAKQTASFWRLMQPQARVDLADIKGRWYEASLLLPILQGKGFITRAQQGDIQEAAMFMNSQGDCVNANRPPNLPRPPKENIRKETRIEAFGAAVPRGLALVDGVQPPAADPPPETIDLSGDGAENEMNIDPRFDTVDDVHRGDPAGAPGATLDEFMNLEGMDDEHTQMNAFQQSGGGSEVRGFY